MSFEYYCFFFYTSYILITLIFETIIFFLFVSVFFQIILAPWSISRHDCFGVPVSLEWSCITWEGVHVFRRTSIHAEGQWLYHNLQVTKLFLDCLQ